MAALEPSLRGVLVLRDVEGLPAVEVARVLGLSFQQESIRRGIRQLVTRWS